MLDCILLEKAGVPAIGIVTDAFVETGKVMAANWGVSEFEFLSVPHPVANRREAELDQLADGVIDDVVRLLTEGHPR
ncbi:MAG: hypothetical protein H8E81_01730 [Deltaproteobacteria bacterium]|nr:hypothetical protein [Deltaproteobacteria bacterium]